MHPLLLLLLLRVCVGTCPLAAPGPSAHGTPAAPTHTSHAPAGGAGQAPWPHSMQLASGPWLG